MTPQDNIEKAFRRQQVRNLGIRAAERREKSDANPFAPDTEDHWEWLDGWCVAKTLMKSDKEFNLSEERCLKLAELEGDSCVECRSPNP